MAIAFCPDCEEPVQLGDRPKVGQRVTCRSCRAELELIEVSPLELDWAFDGPIDDWEEEGEEEEGEEDEEEWGDEDEWEDDEDWDDDEDWEEGEWDDGGDE